ncbi:unnamed protein product [Bemisia tabaci]|uniref:Uncharacterized protein n=1 Tax=Bemisia tabaci TaxID=7038 RepID=A0A9P0AI91_BEMTA|nr:unnamed protein product [Bemisia tabaci]
MFNVTMKVLKHNLWLSLLLLTLSYCSSLKLADIRRKIELTSAHGLRSDGESCDRPCNGSTRTCHFSFHVTEEVSMSILCGDCPFEQKDCYARGCVTAGGYVRRIVTINSQVPGPPIHVCEGDTIKVDVYNHMASESTTIHWHGLRQLGSPYMDGVPFVTQCPILPNNHFTYSFLAEPAGTHMYHGHTGFQEADGLFGAFIIRRKEPTEIQKLYDFDLPEHTVILWHWYSQSTSQKLPIILFRNGTVNGLNLIINGKASGVEYTRGNETAVTPPEIFFVQKGNRYRFRIIVNAAIYCPLQLSIESHTFSVFASESGTFDPIEVESMMINAGERYDIILHADQEPDCYILGVRGIGDCYKTQVRQTALVCYNTVHIGPRIFQKNRNFPYASQPGRLFNAAEEISAHWENNTIIPLHSANSTSHGYYENPYHGEPDHVFYLKTMVKLYPELPIPGPFPQINDIGFEFPTSNLLRKSSDKFFCNYSRIDSQYCIGQFCACTHVLKVKRNSLVEMVFFDTSGADRNQDHPFHIHGHSVRVVASMTVGPHLDEATVRQMNTNGTLKKDLHRAPLKDTFSVPNKGIVVVRLIADNPGYWIVHCHVSNHMELGMAFVLQVGEERDMTPLPRSFPICGDWPNAQENGAPNFTPPILGLLFFVLMVGSGALN